MRCRRVIAGLVVLVMIVALAVLLWPRPPEPGRAAFERVRAGMTYAEVCATVGGPPGDYSGGRNDNYRVWVHNLPACERAWGSRDAVLIVWFDHEWNVSGVSVEDPFGQRFRSHS